MKYQDLLKAVRTSSAAGVLKVTGQISVALIIYPVVIHQGGMGTLGAWVLLQLIVGYGGLTHLGMATIMTKEIAKSLTSRKEGEGENWFRDGLSSALLFSAILVLVLNFFFEPILAGIQKSITEPVSHMTVWVMLVGVLLRLSSAIYGSIIAGHQRTDLIHFSQFLQLVIFGGAFFMLPDLREILFELAVAYTLGCGVEMLFILVSVGLIKPAFLGVGPTLNLLRLRRFLRSLTPYFMINVTSACSEPLVKFAIFLSGGPSAVGVFEVASKVPAAIRHAFLHGLGALLPAFATLSGSKAQATIVRLGQDALHYIFWGSLSALFLYWLNSGRILELWLGSVVNEELLSMTALMTFWWGLTSLNVPAWWLGMGLDSVWLNTRVLGTHVIFTLGLVGLTWLVSMESFTVVSLWVLGGIGMQVVLYILLEKKTKLILPMYLSKKFGVLFSVFAVLAGLTTFGYFWMVRLVNSPDIVLLFSVLAFYLPLFMFALADAKKWRHA